MATDPEATPRPATVGRGPRSGVSYPVPEPGDGHDLSRPEYYLNRELTWLSFNERVLAEAEDPRTPLLERVKFLAIVSANLDEFVMKRLGGLKQQVAAGVRDRTVDGRTPEEQIAECAEVIRELNLRQQALLRELRKELGDAGIQLARHDDLTADQQSWLRDYYLRNIFPLVTPQAMDPAHPFPFISNLSLNLLLTVRHPRDDTPSLTRVKVPVGSGIQRFLRVQEEAVYIPLEEVMAHNLDLLLPGIEIESCELFRVTRNANTERDEDTAEDLLAMIETELRERRFAPIVRMAAGSGMSDFHRGMLAAELGLDEVDDVVVLDGMLGMADLMEIATLPYPDLHDPPHHPVDHPRITRDRNLFHQIRDAGAMLIQHPYESFSSTVDRFLREAAQDPKVRAIKMTLYRTSEDTNVIDLLVEAARNGKQVAVVVELKARFDEDANIRWASRLEEAGIHVTYGVVGLKTHCKVILVVRQDYHGLRRYAHLGTGNYHAGNARIYSDVGLLTSDDAIGEDLTELFNYLTTGFKPKRRYGKVLPAPTLLKRALIDKIDREIELHSEASPGLIQLKMNALEDADVTRALYRASQAGVAVDLLVRDSCRLRPGIAGLSESARVISIVGRFLEHARIYYFRAGGEEEYYIGSADCMKRNLESRVETVVPVSDPRLQAELRYVLDVQLADRVGAWEMQADGTYQKLSPHKGKKARHSQVMLTARAEDAHREATRLRKRSIKGIARRSSD